MVLAFAAAWITACPAATIYAKLMVSDACAQAGATPLGVMVFVRYGAPGEPQFTIMIPEQQPVSPDQAPGAIAGTITCDPVTNRFELRIATTLDTPLYEEALPAMQAWMTGHDDQYQPGRDIIFARCPNQDDIETVPVDSCQR